ncbi:MAG: 16S rRNA (guanine(527)-N(7))-methyltransferase RsmG [Candidatus Nanopelagicales bacterium]
MDECLSESALAAQRYPDVVQALGQYRDLLANEGLEWGLIGPREVDRLWERHILNCIAVADSAEDIVPKGASVIDVGSGAGLPGIVWAIARPDLHVTLVEPLARRVRFLELAVEQLNLTDRVDVVRARAETCPPELRADVVTARAVASLPKLVSLLLPLTTPGGCVVALKGQKVAEEIAEAGQELTERGAQSVRVRQCGVNWLSPATTVVIVTGSVPTARGGTRSGKNRRRR